MGKFFRGIAGTPCVDELVIDTKQENRLEAASDGSLV